ncbi:hypothetical protein Patl1_10790 [Pistacia atlantica]|uniref:Uncharacterized protein n=1 Tax=Pistacia atlantica TaxID=434234 RepID=A0ACC1A5S6_9ROSI|nr:hypothetical protein Patl1_10790 [Pistacia atlantica]
MNCGCFTGSSKHGKGDDVPQAYHGVDGQLRGNVNYFSYKELRKATEDFHLSNKIGRGGFGTVYKVLTWLPCCQGVLKNGKQIAVKTLSAESKQGVQEFRTEVNTLSDVKHPNLVELLGCCIQGTKRILVYEYVENSSLDRVLLGYLLDLADAYSELDILFMLLLFLRLSSEQADYQLGYAAWQLHEEGRLLELVDSEMEEFPPEDVIRYMKVAFFCTQAAASRRPLMSQVVEMLSKNIRLNEKELTAPGFFQDSESSRGTSSKKSADSTVSQMSSVPITITQVTPR